MAAITISQSIGGGGACSGTDGVTSQSEGPLTLKIGVLVRPGGVIK